MVNIVTLFWHKVGNYILDKAALKSMVFLNGETQWILPHPASPMRIAPAST